MQIELTEPSAETYDPQALITNIHPDSYLNPENHLPVHELIHGIHGNRNHELSTWEFPKRGDPNIAP